jgi:oxygen-independent coproporphyrinogen-3 oxidase
VDEYLDALSREIRAGAKLMSGRRPLTFYMGGGTPTTLSAGQMDRLLGELEESFDFSDALEITVEAGRPDSITPEKLSVLRKHGIRRISINPQSMNQETLDLIGRRHTVEDVVRAFTMAREQGFDNINMDLIAGLPGERAEHMQRTMDAVCALRPDSITVHSLALKRAAFLNQNRELFPVAETGEVNRMIAISRQCSAQIGLSPYYLYRQKNIAGNLENVGYAREGCEGVYNILIMEEKQTILALGAGASSKFVFPAPDGTSRIERVMNVKSVSDYIGRIDEMISRKETFCSKNLSRRRWK